MKKIMTFCVICVCAILALNAQNNNAAATIHTYEKTDGPDKNPLKGWNSGWWNDYDHASVGFQYLSWKNFEPTNGNFDFNAVENVLSRPGSIGRHFILRLYIDWHGDTAISQAGPSWLYDDYNVARLQSANGRYLTDFNNADLITQATEAVEALANHYDNDPRVYAIQIGILGYWGEWHVSGFGDTYEINTNTKNQILNAYKTNFSRAKLMGRYPWHEPLASTGGIGFHNDFFGPNNHSDEFDDSIFFNNKWLEGPIGGELPPGLSQSDFDLMYGTARGINMIERGHYSTMQGSSPCINSPNSANCDGFMAMHRKMGYNFQIDSAVFPNQITQYENLNVDLNIENVGVAALYYDWDIQYALLDDNNVPVKIIDVLYDLTSIMPDDTIYTIPMTIPVDDLQMQNYKLGARMLQPGASDAKTEAWGLDARNVYIQFSNNIPIIEGSWNSNNALIGGWSVLGSVDVNDGTLSTNDELLSTAISVFPNPVKNQLKISNNTNVPLQDLKIFDVSGRLIKSLDSKITDREAIFNIDHLSSGLYIVVINSDRGKITKRFVKN